MMPEPQPGWNRVHTFRTPPDVCSYLPEETMQLEVRCVYTMDQADYAQLLAEGWRRQGISFFRPTCPACKKCRSLRVLVDQFKPSKSQRRIWRKNNDVRFEIGEPTYSPRHLEIFDAYHRDMQRRRGWDYHCIDAEMYMELFLTGTFPFAREFRYYLGDKLVGVGLVDVTDRCSSSVYFYHDPDWRVRGPGVYSILAELQNAGRLGLTHHFLGYWIAECHSMAYKSRYRPHEVIQLGDSDDPPFSWLPADNES